MGDLYWANLGPVVNKIPEKSGISGPNLLEALEREKARLLEQATAKIESEMAEIARLAIAYPDAFKAIARQMGLVEQPQPKANPSGIQTLGDLIEMYRTSPNSPIQTIKHNSRETYEALISLIRADYADQRLAEADAQTLDAWYAKWRDGGKVAISNSKMTMLRGLLSFGIMSARDENCARLFGLLGQMKIELPKVRTEHLTRDQANLIRAKAHEKERPSIALAQAFQSDVGLIQKDAVGEWVPMGEPGISDIIQDNLKWVRGLRWEEIDANLILTHSAGDKEIRFDLKNAPMVVEELERAKIRNGGHLPTRGPVIVSEWDKLPWTAPEFRRWWRRLADECGIPKTVRNADSRVKAGNEPEGAAITENKSGDIFK